MLSPIWKALQLTVKLQGYRDATWGTVLYYASSWLPHRGRLLTQSLALVFEVTPSLVSQVRLRSFCLGSSFSSGSFSLLVGPASAQQALLTLQTC